MHTACDASKEIISRLKKVYPDVNFTTDFGELLECKDIKAVVISTPAASHYEFVKKALLAGKDVFVEKPLALTVKEAEELLELAESKKKY